MGQGYCPSVGKDIPGSIPASPTEVVFQPGPPIPPPNSSSLEDVRPDAWGECLPAAHPAHARRATFVLSILSLAPSLSSPREVPQVDRTRQQTFPARHLA